MNGQCAILSRCAVQSLGEYHQASAQGRISLALKLCLYVELRIVFPLYAIMRHRTMWSRGCQHATACNLSASKILCKKTALSEDGI